MISTQRFYKDVVRLSCIIFLIVGIITTTSSTCQAVPASSEMVFEVYQPDGSILTLSPIGDERNGRYLTLDGYTVIRSNEGWYQYAILDTNDHLSTSGMIALNSGDRSPATNPESLGITKKLSGTDNRLKPTLDHIETFQKPETKLGDFQTVNDILVIMIKFPDEDTTYSIIDFDDLMNRPGFGTYGSVNDYYLEASYGQFGVNGIVIGWYTATQNRAYYGYNDGNNWGAAAELAREAVVAAKNTGIDFTPFDNDNDGEVDGLFIVHAGPGAETGASGYPWSHLWCLTCAGLSPVTANGKTINTYTMEPERQGSSTSTIGVFCHEYGHALGLPDLYDTDGSSIGIGRWGLMAGGSWNGGGASPAHPSAWSKVELGWVIPTIVTSDITPTTLLDSETNPEIYRLWTEGTIGTEYFLVEYRRQVGFDAFLPGCGVAIWHIDETIPGNADETHRKVDLEEADGSENNSSGDLWLAQMFDSLSTPSNLTYAGVATSVTVITHTSTCEELGILVDLMVAIPPPCCTGIRGDINYDGNPESNITDLTFIVDFLFRGGAEPECPEEANIDGDIDDEVTITDVTFLVDYLFRSGQESPACQQ